MLQSKYNNLDVVAFKLITGEETLARIEKETDTEFVISKPMTLIPQGQGLVMNQSIFSVDVKTQHIRLNKGCVVMHALARQEIVNDYIQGTTGIQTVPAGSGTGHFEI